MAKQDLNPVSKDVKRLAARFGSLFKRRRDRALEQVRLLGPAGVEALQQMFDGYKGKRRRLRIMFWAPFVLIMLSVTLIDVLAPRPTAPVDSGSLLVMGLFYVCCVYMWQAAPRIRQTRVIRLLCALRDPSSLSRLIEALGQKELDLTAVLPAALDAMLKGITPEIAATIPAHARLLLYRQLSKDDPLLIMAILRAIIVFQDGTALPFVDRLAHRRTWSSIPVSVSNYAASLLPELRALAERAQTESTLLRASSAGIAATALRPADATTVVPEELLRAPGE